MEVGFFWFFFLGRIEKKGFSRRLLVVVPVTEWPLPLGTFLVIRDISNQWLRKGRVK